MEHKLPQKLKEFMNKINYLLVNLFIQVIRDRELNYELNVNQKDKNLIMTLNVKGYKQLKIERRNSNLIFNNDIENQIENINYMHENQIFLELDYQVQNLKPDENLNNKKENSDLLLS